MDMLLLGDRIVNLEHLTQAQFTPGYAGGEPMEDDPDTLSSPRPAELTLTLTSVRPHRDFDYYGNFVGMAATADDVEVSGALAEQAWAWLKGKALGGNGEMAQALAFKFKEAQP